jgi:hypothetical protein
MSYGFRKAILVAAERVDFFVTERLHQTMLGINIRVLRLFMGGAFAIASLICILMAVWIIERTFQIQLNKAFSHPLALLLDAIFPLMATVYGVAAWTTWKEEPSARFWGIAASILQILLPVRQIFFRSRPIWSCHGFVLAVGILGLIVFLWPSQKEPETEDAGTCEADPDDSKPEDNPF